MLGSKKEFWEFMRETEEWIKTRNIPFEETKRIVFCHRSITTFSNAEFAFLFLECLKELKILENKTKITLNVVTNDWHLLRAVLIFKRYEL